MATSTLSNILLDKEILLESGTNELEVLVFDVANYTFGINVAKVREVLPAATITALPRAHRSIRGVFKLRSQVIPCVSLLEHLGIAPTRENTESTMILTDLNQQQTAFLVDTVERIHRLSWENILAVPGLEALAHTPVTALARCEGRLVVMLDFEMILDDVTNHYFRVDEVANPMGLARESLRIILAEDSPTVREAIGNTLSASGYHQLTFCENGAEAWKTIEERWNQSNRTDQVCDLVIADVEMPQVDGFHLTRRIKQHPQLKRIPVLLYSSIITPDNHKKGQAVGADAQVAKPELTKVVRLADELISTARRDNMAAAIAELTQTSQSPTPSVSNPTSSSVVESPVDTHAPEPSPVETAELFESPSPSAAPTAGPEPSAGLLSADAASPVLATADLLQTASHEITIPAGVSPKLWRTFHNELAGRTAHLHDLLQQALTGDLSDDIFRDVARTLHTIKSASMVVPVDPVTQCTHAAESLLELARHNRQQWPHDQLAQYTNWLHELTSFPDDINTTLAMSSQLEDTLGRALQENRR